MPPDINADIFWLPENKSIKITSVGMERQTDPVFHPMGTWEVAAVSQMTVLLKPGYCHWWGVPELFHIFAENILGTGFGVIH